MQLKNAAFLLSFIIKLKGMGRRKNKRTRNKILRPTPQPVNENVSNKEQLQDSQKLTPSKNFTIVVQNSSDGVQLQNQQRRVLLPNHLSDSGNIFSGKQITNPQKPALSPNFKAVTDNSLPRTWMQNPQRRALHPVLTGATENLSYGMQKQCHQGLTSIPVWEKSPWTFGENFCAANFQNPMRSGFTSLTTFEANTFNSKTTARSNFANISACSSPTRPTAKSTAIVPPNNFILSGNCVLNNSSGIRVTNRATSTTSIQRYPSTSESMNRNQLNRHYASLNRSSAVPVISINDDYAEDDEDDVTYLFTVDSTPDGRILEEIDLESEAVNPTGGSVEPINRNNIPTQPTDNPPSTNVKTPAILTIQKTRKRKACDNDENSSKRANREPFQPRCSVCGLHYDELTGSAEHMCIATSCGHLFCQPCIRKGGKTCNTCGERILSVRRLYL